MAPRVGEVIYTARAEHDEPTQALVVGHDTAGTPEIVPYDAVPDLPSLERYVGPTRARELARHGIYAAELGV